MLRIKVILGSTRQGRFGMQPANWVTDLGKTFGDKAAFELIDLAELNLPLFDLPVPPSLAPTHQTDQQAAWAKIIDEADGFVFVTAEYNHSIPAALKNAFDYLWDEWAYKPVAFVGYGAEAGGARAMEHLREVTSFAKMYDISEHVLIREYYLNQDENSIHQFTDTHNKKAIAMLEQLIFWADVMKPARKKLKSETAK